MKAINFAVLCFVMMASAHAEQVSCHKVKYEPEVPAALLGKYDVVGKMPGSHAAYGGTLEINAGKTAYALKRTVNGKTMSGEAWIERCGTGPSPGVEILRFNYARGKDLLDGYCFFQSDLENYMLLSCYTNPPAKRKERPGIEAAFPIKDF